MGLEASATGLAGRAMLSTSASRDERLSPRYWDLLRRTNQKKAQSYAGVSGSFGGEGYPSPGIAGQKAFSVPAQTAVNSSVSRGALFGPPVAMKVGGKLVSLGDSPWPEEHVQWAGAGAAAIAIGTPHHALGFSWDGGIPKTEKPVKHGAIHQSVAALFPIALVSLSVITVFTLLYVLTDSLVSQVAAPLQMQDNFFYSLRTFLTFSAVDTAPGSSLGRFLNSAEGLLGYLVMLWFAVKIGQLTGGGEK